MLAQNDGRHIQIVITTTACPKHKAKEGEPCWLLPNNVDPLNERRGVCNSRALKAGYNGRIQATSIRAHAPSRNK